MVSISKLSVNNFRCYDQGTIEGLSCGVVVLTGANGAGKTNMLEALSLLAPGRGLRGARSSEIQKQDCRPALEPWAVSAQAETLYGPVRIGTGSDALTDKRIVRINGETVRAQTALAEYMACVWLTPQMDRLFLEAPGARRRFLDRLVFAFDPGHAGRLTRYEKAISQRSRILKDHESPDPAWLEGIESVLAETGVAVAAARIDLVTRLQQAVNTTLPPDDTLFPRSIISLRGAVEELLGQAPAVEVEDMIRYQLRQTRLQDRQSGTTATGPHRSDLAVVYTAKSMPAGQCSTGEQKALLIGIVLAHARLIAAERGAAPLLLLDEVAAHLDDRRRAGLYDVLWDMKGQAWLTGTDAHLFDALGPAAQRFHVENGRLAPLLSARRASSS